MNLLIICIFILNILLILQVIYYFKEFKSNSKKIKKLVLFIVFSLFFIGKNVNAAGIVYLTCDNNGCEVVNRCDNQYFCQSPLLNSNEVQFNFDNANFTIDNTYNFNLNFTTTSPSIYGTPNIYDCNLAINGSFVVATRNSGRTGFECGSDHCDASFVSSMSYTMPQSYSNVPNFIRCQMNTTRYNYTQFTYSTNSNQGSVINAINQNGNNQIQTANNNAQQNNANRDSNTNRIIGKLGDVISGITNTGSDIVSGIVNGINTAKNFILNKMSDIITAIGNIVSPIVNAVTTIGSNIVTAIGNGVTGIVNKIGEMIGTQEVCEIYYSTIGSNVENGDPNVSNGFLDSSGNIINNQYYLVTPFIEIPSNSGSVTLTNNYYNPPTIYYCVYNSNKVLNSCYLVPGSSSSATINNSLNVQYVRYSFTNGTNSTTKLSGNCHKTGLASIFNRLGQFFNNFTQFVKNLFNNSLGNVWENININVADNTPVSDLLTLPLSFLRKLNSSLRTQTRSGSGGGVHDCVSYTIPFDFTGGNNTLTFPCLDLERYFGSELWNLIDLALSGYIIINIGFMVIHFFESWTSFKDTFDELYQPAHGAYVPRHSGGDRGYFD